MEFSGRHADDTPRELHDRPEGADMIAVDLLAARLAEAGLGVESVTPVTGGVVAVAGLATLSDGSRVFAKTLRAANEGTFGDACEPNEGIFQLESEGLHALRRLGGASTPAVLLTSPRVLVLEPMRQRRDDAAFWEQLARMVAALHQTTVSNRFGWHRDGWLGRLRQDNTWDEDGYAFFAQRRILRWLAEPLVEMEFDLPERRALERLCARLPELIPPQSPALTHGDLWSGNILADGSDAPVLVDPAVSYTWPEVDISMLWCSPRPPESQRFFDVYQEQAGLADGWQDRMPILQLRELLSVLAHGDDKDGGAAGAIREVIAPFRSSDIR